MIKMIAAACLLMDLFSLTIFFVGFHYFVHPVHGDQYIGEHLYVFDIFFSMMYDCFVSQHLYCHCPFQTFCLPFVSCTSIPLTHLKVPFIDTYKKPLNQPTAIQRLTTVAYQNWRAEDGEAEEGTPKDYL